MRKKKPVPDERQAEMFELGSASLLQPQKRTFKRIAQPLWTRNKARLIDRYLFYFLMVTKHGTYIDGFAGPQVPSRPGSWAANLVLKSRPRWLRHFYLFEINREKIGLLKQLKEREKRVDPKRTVRVIGGDFNKTVRRVLRSRPIRPAQATFCLLDQRAFECHWDTVRRLAAYKGGVNNKIEVFYLLAVGWLHRSLSSVKRTLTREKLERWWGGTGWESVRGMRQEELVNHFVGRFKKLGYRFVAPWPIYQERFDRDRRIMYYMIHASDHPQAPELMQRAYHNAVRPKETEQQLALMFGQPPTPS